MKCEGKIAEQVVTNWQLVTISQLVKTWQLVTTLIPAALYRSTWSLKSTIFAWSHLATGHTWQLTFMRPESDHDLSPGEGFGSISLKTWEP